MAGAFGSAVSREERDRLAALLREAREEAGLRQGELAARLGVPQSVLSKMELGQREVGALELRAVCRALGVPLATFLGRLEDRLAGRG